MFKYTRHTLKKLESVFEENAYEIRYEKGNFSSGYCILFDKRVIIVNKFLGTEGRINSLLQILEEVDIEANQLPDKLRSFYQQLQNLG